MGSALPLRQGLSKLKYTGPQAFFFFQTLGTDPFPLLMMCNCQNWWVIPM